MLSRPVTVRMTELLAFVVPEEAAHAAAALALALASEVRAPSTPVPPLPTTLESKDIESVSILAKEQVDQRLHALWSSDLVFTSRMYFPSN